MIAKGQRTGQSLHAAHSPAWASSREPLQPLCPALEPDSFRILFWVQSHTPSGLIEFLGVSFLLQDVESNALVNLAHN